MERDNLSKYNIINGNDGETIIGFYGDLIVYFKAVAKDYIDSLDIEDYQSVIEIIELLQDLKQKYNHGILGFGDLLEVGYNPMGAYTFCRLVKENK